MNEALAGFWWFEDLSLLMDRGGHVLWAVSYTHLTLPTRTVV